MVGHNSTLTIPLNVQIPGADNLVIMNRRFIALLAMLALVLAACGDVTESSDTTTSTPPADTTTTVDTTPTADGAVLAYVLAAGQTYTFEVDLEQTIEMTASGDATAMGEDEIPGSMELEIGGSGTFTYTVSDGPEAGTYSVNISGEFTDLSFTGTMDGDPVDHDEIPDLADLGPVDVTIVVDEKGHPITDDFELDGMLGGLFGGFEGLENFSGAGVDFGFFGPPLSDDEVGVGDSWTSTIEIPGMDDEVYTTEIRSTITGTDTVDGAETLVIETVTNTPLIEFDMAEMIIGMFETFLGMFGEPSDAELAEFLEIADQIRFLFRIPAARADATTWFDAEAGLTRRSEVSGSGRLIMDIAMPDEETGEMVEFAMDLASTQKLSYRLISASDS